MGSLFESLAVAQFTRLGGHPLQPDSNSISKAGRRLPGGENIGTRWIALSRRRCQARGNALGTTRSTYLNPR